MFWAPKLDLVNLMKYLYIVHEKFGEKLSQGRHGCGFGHCMGLVSGRSQEGLSCCSIQAMGILILSIQGNMAKKSLLQLVSGQRALPPSKSQSWKVMAMRWQHRGFPSSRSSAGARGR